MDRRDLIRSLLMTVASHSLLQVLFTREAFSASIRPIAGSWVKELNEMSADLQGGRIRPAAWQAKLQELFDRVEGGSGCGSSWSRRL
jgi:hypothetical protein